MMSFFLKFSPFFKILWLLLSVHSGSLKRIYNSKLFSMTHTPRAGGGGGRLLVNGVPMREQRTQNLP